MRRQIGDLWRALMIEGVADREFVVIARLGLGVLLVEIGGLLLLALLDK